MPINHPWTPFDNFSTILWKIKLDHIVTIPCRHNVKTPLEMPQRLDSFPHGSETKGFIKALNNQSIMSSQRCLFNDILLKETLGFRQSPFSNSILASFFSNKPPSIRCSLPHHLISKRNSPKVLTTRPSNTQSSFPLPQ